MFKIIHAMIFLVIVKTMKEIVLTEYMTYRATLRGYDLGRIEQILRFGAEKYFDSETGRQVAVGSHKEKLILIPYVETETKITPITVHATTRQQIRFRINTGRFKYG